MNRIKELREERNLSQSELAKKINLPRTSIVRWERETNEIGHLAIIELARFFDVSIDFLLGLSDDPTRNWIQL